MSNLYIKPKQVLKFETLCKHVHEVLHQYAHLTDEPYKTWDELSDKMKESTELGVIFVLTHPTVTAKDVHEQWMKIKTEEGWTCGSVKDESKKEHPCMVPFDQLPLQHVIKDYIFVSVVRASAKVLQPTETTIPALEEVMGGFDGPKSLLATTSFFDNLYTDVLPGVAANGQINIV